MANGWVALGVSLISAIILLFMIGKYNNWDVLWYWNNKPKKDKRKKK